MSWTCHELYSTMVTNAGLDQVLFSFCMKSVKKNLTILARSLFYSLEGCSCCYWSTECVFLILWPFAHTGDKPSQLLHFTTYIKSSPYLTLRAAELHQNLFVQVESSQCDHTVPTVCFTAMLAALLACTTFAHLLKAKCLPFPANMLTMFTSWFLGQHVYHFVSVQCYNMLTFAKRKAINTDSAAKNVIRHLSIN